MKITFDTGTDMAYVHMSEAKYGAVIRTEEVAGALVDLDIEGKVIGIEFFNPFEKGFQVDAVIEKYVDDSIDNPMDWFLLRNISMIDFKHE